MGLFKAKGDSASDDTSVAADVLADSIYLEELRELGRTQLKELIASQSGRLESELGTITEQVAIDIKEHATARVDALVGRLDTELTSQLNERMREFNQVTSEAQELVAQSLSRNAQMVHEKFQQLSLDLQRTIASQEVMMATVFQDNKTQVAAIQSQQEKVLEELKASEATTQHEAEALTQALRQTVSGQAAKLGEIYQQNMESVEQTKDAQAAMLETLTRTTEALESQYAQLGQLLTKSIADEKAMVTEIINDNMARIVEHYLIGALGEQSGIREQLPSILEHMEESKQAMVDDMQL
jgi:hypothetical protein